MKRLEALCVSLRPRLRVFVLELVDLKNRNWTNRFKESISSSPHRLEEIRADFESEQERLVKSQTLIDSVAADDCFFDSNEFKLTTLSRRTLPTIKELLSFDYAKHVFDEYTKKNFSLDNSTVEHALRDIENLRAVDIREFVRDLISIGVYRDARSRKSTGELIYTCLRDELLDREHFANGLRLFWRSLSEREEDADNNDIEDAAHTSVAAQIAQFLSQLIQPEYIK